LAIKKKERPKNQIHLILSKLNITHPKIIPKAYLKKATISKREATPVILSSK
jgi:hypothetical protein